MPTSLRLYNLARHMRAPVIDVMGESYELLREWECYAEHEQAEARRRETAAARARSRQARGR